MKGVTVRELRTRLSAYLKDVAQGEVILVTDRGRVVAELRRPSQHAEAYGRTRIRLKGGSSQALLDADRTES